MDFQKTGIIGNFLMVIKILQFIIKNEKTLFPSKGVIRALRGRLSSSGIKHLKYC